MGLWIYYAIKRGGDIPACLRTQGPRLSGKAKAKLVQTPQFKEMMKHRFGIEIRGRPNAQTSVQMMPVYDFPLRHLTRARIAADIHWIQTVFEKHGTSDGILWIALQYPALLSRIRYAFLTAKTFLHFVHTRPDAAEATEREGPLEQKRK